MDKPRAQSSAEERANAISHGVGCAAIVVLAPMLWSITQGAGHEGRIWGVAIFAVSMLLVYLVSAVYHGLPHSRAKAFFEKADYLVIFVFIAGSYTPFALSYLRGAEGWLLFGLVWGLAFVGILLRAWRLFTRPLATTAVYLVVGWAAMAATVPLADHAPAACLDWLIAGALVYTLGAAFYLNDARLRYGHFVWHLFVMTGSACHCLAVFRYAA